MSKCWYCNEELTTANYCDEHIGICIKCYCSMFQFSNEFVKGLTDKISDLEAKLEESERKYDKLFECYKNTSSKDLDDKYRLADENEQLKQQLAQKEKELENYKLCKCVSCKNEYEFMLEGMVSDLERELDKADQDKISFAVEQLTEIRDYVKECWGLDELEGKVRLDIAKKIRLKIEELKAIKEIE